MRHLHKPAASIAGHNRAIVLHRFYYDNPGFRFYRDTNYDEVMRTVQACRDAGLELWQANFELTPKCVNLLQYYQLEEW